MIASGPSGTQVDMPTRPTKGDHGHADRGSSGRGPQKATYGTSVSPDVAAAQRELIENRIDGEDRDETKDQATRDDEAGPT